MSLNQNLNTPPMTRLGIIFLICATTISAHAQSISPLTITQTAPEQFRLDWLAVNNFPYQMEGSLDLDTWINIGPIVVGSGIVETMLISNTAPKYFYRLREGAVRPGFDQIAMLREDDHTYNQPVQSAEAVNLGFSVNFYGNNFSQCFVNNNGNITFEYAQSLYTPLPFGFLDTKMIAAFWADVDTRGPISGVPKFSSPGKTISGRPAFGVTYKDVGYFSSKTDKLNTFQLILIDRSDIAAGDFDIEFNYEKILWETGSALSSGGVEGYGGRPARVGIASGTGLFLEYKNSGETLKFLDVNPTTGFLNKDTGLIYQTYNSVCPGRIVLPIRNGLPPGTFSVNAGEDRNLNVDDGGSFQLGCTPSPPGLMDVTFLWEQIDGPDNTQIIEPSSQNPTVLISEPGTYEFRVTASRPGNFSTKASDTIEIRHPAVFQLGSGSYQLFSPDSYSLTMDQSVLVYNGSSAPTINWTQISGSPAVISNPNILKPTITLPGPGSFFFELKATTTQSVPFTKSVEVEVFYSE